MTGRKHVVLVDTGLCNLDSIRRACEEVGGSPRVTRDPRDVEAADRLILPGVGHFSAAVRSLSVGSLLEAITTRVAHGSPLLGICLGMQLLGTKSSEGDSRGLGLIDAENVVLEPTQAGERVPHIGWNNVEAAARSVLLREVAAEADFYFVHSYHMVASAEVAKATTPYCGGFVSVVEDPPVFGVQFHPEKSQRAGFQVLRNFLAF